MTKKKSKKVKKVKNIKLAAVKANIALEKQYYKELMKLGNQKTLKILANRFLRPTPLPSRVADLCPIRIASRVPSGSS